jgi:hypothetical protein
MEDWMEMLEVTGRSVDWAAVNGCLAQLNEQIHKARVTAEVEKHAPRGTSQPLTAKALRSLLKARRVRSEYFPTGLFSDPAWDMLLDLMAAKLEGHEVTVSSLCIAAAVPPTTALRWIKSMTEQGILVRTGDKHDGRRAYISLSSHAAEAVQNYWEKVNSPPQGV